MILRELSITLYYTKIILPILHCHEENYIYTIKRGHCHFLTVHNVCS